MIAAFSGFAFGRFVGLQEFGVGLSMAIPARRHARAGAARPGHDEASRPLDLGPARASPAR
jgi:hypothetical protein